MRRRIDETNIPHQRVWDLLRQCRHKLLDENLISREEYAWLLADAPNVLGRGSPAPRRLETYDDHESRMKATAKRWKALAELAANDALSKSPAVREYGERLLRHMADIESHVPVNGAEG